MTSQTKKQKNQAIYTAITLILAVTWNQGIYYGARIIASQWPHKDLTLPIDEMIPVLPWTVSIYFGCYLFWAMNYYLCTKQPRQESDRFFCADLLSKAVCFFLFILLPTTNVRPAIEGLAFWDSAIRMLYTIDSPDNLFPSIHCLVSWLSWIGVRNRKDIPFLYRGFSLLMALAVCFSTLATKQHVLLDVLGGVCLGEICYWIAGNQRVCSIYTRQIDRLVAIFNRNTTSFNSNGK